MPISAYGTYSVGMGLFGAREPATHSKIWMVISHSVLLQS